MALNSRTFDSMRPWLLAVVALLVAVVGVFIVVTTLALNKQSSFERTWVRNANALQVDSLRLSKAAVESSLGNLDAFRDLAQVHLRMFAQMQALKLGSPADALPPVTDNLPEEFGALERTWASMSEDAQLIINSDTRINELAGASTGFLTAIPAIQADTDRMVGQLIESGSPSPQVFAASRQLVLADRMQRRALEILQNTGDSTAAAAELSQETALFEQVLYALRNGNSRMGITPVRNPQASASLNQVRRQYEAVKPQLEVIVDASQNLLDIRQAADRIFSESDRMFEQAQALATAIGQLPQERLWPSARANTAALGVLILLALVLLVLVMITASRRADTAVRHNRKAQQAIIRLLDDLGALGEGDLTVRADVTDEITGAIADGVNYAVEQLRELVLGVNETALAVADSAETTRRATGRLAASAEEQAGQVSRATETVQSMSSAFGAMADRSRKSRDTAIESVEAAHSGAERVRETITGMDRIREQIQETSKRIKRLGESTQEIGDIVKMINDIAEQTNVLALNAAIQAASAGSSGQGFGMVADEVQQLAESATSATRRIATLVETIQIDTGEAIKSMEETTSEVVNGARLAKDAGSALVQIEESSNELSTLIRDISSEAARHSEQAQRISDLMDGIRDISMRTSEGTTQTADAVAELAELVLELRESVSHFKLPGAATETESREQAT